MTYVHAEESGGARASAAERYVIGNRASFDRDSNMVISMYTYNTRAQEQSRIN